MWVMLGACSCWRSRRWRWWRRQRLQSFIQVTKSFRQAKVLGVVDRTGDHRDSVVSKRLLQRRQQLISSCDSIPFGAKAFRILHHIGIGELDVVVLAQVEIHLPFDEPVAGVLP